MKLRTYALLSAVLALSIASFAQNTTKPSFTIVNTDSNPVPAKIVNTTPLAVAGTIQLGNPNVSVINTPNVNVANSPTVNVGSIPAIDLVAGAKVTLDTSAGPITVRSLEDGPRSKVVRLGGYVDLKTQVPNGWADLGLTGSSGAAYVVPDGKRLVVQQWSGYANVPLGEKAEVQFGGYSCGATITQAWLVPLQLSVPDGSWTDVYRGTDHGSVYVDAGEKLTVFFVRSQATRTGTASGAVHVSGYLVDCGPGECQSECP